MRANCICLVSAAAGLMATSAVRAAGHLDVDDPYTLSPGECQVETWAGRASSDRAKLWHVGPACQLGPVQIGLNIDGANLPGERSVEVGPSVKWNFYGDSDSLFAAGVSAALTFDAREGGRQGGQLLLPVAWHPTQTFWLYGNIGSDWATGTGARTGRGGLGLEWHFVPDKLALLAERNRAGGEWTTRAGFRYFVTPALNLDLTASRVDGARYTGFILGLRYGFGANPAAPTASGPARTSGIAFAER